MVDLSDERKRCDPSSSESTARDGYVERLIDESRRAQVVGTEVVDNRNAISRGLLSTVAAKASQIEIVFTDVRGQVRHYHGQSGLLQGRKIASSPGQETPKSKRQRTGVRFERFASYAATPVTAKHNIASEDNESFVSAMMKFPHHQDCLVQLPGAGCVQSDRITLRPAPSDDEDAITWKADDVAFGTEIRDSMHVLTKKPLHFGRVPSDFDLQVGQKIGISVFRKFEISPQDANAAPGTDMALIYGPKNRPCIYTGEVKHVSGNGRTFEHDINTFKGCSGAIIFLLDADQSDSVDETYYGMAVGIHVGGVRDCQANIGFKL